MSETLHTCPVCLTPNFTERGLRAHKCKGGTRLNPETGLVDVIEHDPWDRPRQLLEGISLAVRISIAGQVLLGHELATLKKDMGFTHGSQKRFSPSGKVFHLEQTWPDLVKEKLGISYKTANNFIDCFEAAKVRLKKLGHLGTLPDGTKKLELLFTARPSGLSDDDRATLAKAVDKLVDGDTQRELLQDLKIIKAHVPLTGGDTSAHKKDKLTDQEMMGQLAFKFFRPIADTLHSMRTNPDREAFLHTIPITSSEADEISLTTLEIDLEAALHDVKAAKKARLKPTTGTVIK